MQILNKSFYDEKLNSSTTYTVTTSNPRGEIYDAAGNLLVSNTVKQVVAFTRSNTITAEEMKELAAKLSTLVTFTETNVTTRQKKIIIWRIQILTQQWSRVCLMMKI